MPAALALERNVHLDHLEDQMFLYGATGIRNALKFCQGLLAIFTHAGRSSISLSIKFDGAPAIISGIDPQTKKFFVATKSLFAKTPTVFYTQAQIAAKHDGDLLTKLSLALTYLSKIGYHEIVQGDFLFAPNDLKDKEYEGVEYVTFQPNVLVYAVGKGTPAAKAIERAKMGFVFHTTYVGKNLNALTPQFRVPRSLQNLSDPNVWTPPNIIQNLTSTIALTSTEVHTLRKNIKDGTSLAKQINNKVLNNIVSSQPLGAMFLRYHNAQIASRIALDDTILYLQGFYAWLLTQQQVEMDKLKTFRGKTRVHATWTGYRELIANNESSFIAFVKLFKHLTSMKISFLRHLQKPGLLQTFVETERGLEVTQPEGVVAVESGTKNAIKLIDRLEFSRLNFTLPKQWIK